ncbi:MAG: hypothetical protein AABZ33_00055 [Chloroflexota bacterium]
MTMFRRRRPDDWASEHERARVLSALDLVERLPSSDAAWLSDHLLECATCRELAAAYEADRLLLRSLRDTAPEPPRDLWARTAAAIEQEAWGAVRAWRLPRIGHVPLGAASGLLVVAVVVGVTLFGKTPPETAVVPTAPPATPGPDATPGSTPLAIPPNQVAWVQKNDLGTYDLFVVGFDAVCSVDAGAECAPIDSSAGKSVELSRAPGSVVLSPTAPQIVVVDVAASTTGGSVFIVPVPAPQPSFDPSATPSPTPIATPDPTPPPDPTPTPQPTPPPSNEPSASPTGSPDATPDVTPAPTPIPIAEGAVAIISDVIVVGDPAYSPDGTWFAFSARPADGSAGPDIYVWQSSDEMARPVTFDGRSVFTGWIDDLVLGSRAVPIGVIIDDLDPTSSPATRPPATAGPPSPGTDPGSTSSPDPGASPAIPEVFDGVAFVLDPATGASVDLVGSSWRPVVDPSGRLVVFWEGALLVDGTGVGWGLGEGRLLLDAWIAPERPQPPIDPDASPSPDTGSPAPTSSAPTPSAPASTEPSSSLDPSMSPPPVVLRTVLADGPVVDFDARWDPTGTRLAVWIADPADPKIGSLRLFVVDPDTGVLSPSEDRLDGAPALRGFSLERGRLAWITPPGQDGEGSRLHVVAWSLDRFGTIESRPGSELIVLQ